MSYYDIDDILAEQVRIPCKFNMDIEGIGFLEEGTNPDIKAEAKVDIPIWLAEIMGGVPVYGEDGEELRILDFVKPEQFSRKTMNAIKANSENLYLRSLATNYYKLAEKWGYMFEDVEFTEAIMEMLKNRSVLIDDYAHGSNVTENEEVSRFLNGLDEKEKQLFKISAMAHKDMKEWMSN